MAKRSRQPGIADAADGSVRTPLKPTRAKPMTPSNIAITPVKDRTVVTPSKTARGRIVVGVDFGTSYTGVSYVMTINSDARDIAVITDWPGGIRRNEQLEKVPSRIAYQIENPDLLDRDCFGYEVEPGMKSYSWFKLLLDEDAALTEFDNPFLEKQHGHGLLELPVGKTATDVTADFLRFIYQHTMAKLCKEISGAIVGVTAIDFWFTVPAKWSDAAKAATLTAARAAGFDCNDSRPDDKLSLITEPEAAGLAIIGNSIEKIPGLYKLNSSVLILDLGGGTVDEQCETIIKLDPLQLEETCEGIGGKSGSTYIDCNFYEWMNETFGKAFKSLPAIKVAPGSTFMEQFECAKKSFNGRDLGKRYYLHLPALKKQLDDANISSSSYDAEDHAVILYGADIAAMFQPVIDTTIGLVREQLELSKKEKAQFKTICLCGGLGSSEYVWAKVREFCDGALKGGIELVTDERAWSAVVRGAAVRGLDGSVVLSRKARKWYGIGIHQQFREDVDKEEDMFMCPLKGKRADGYVDWPLKKGRRITQNMRVETKVYVPVDVDDDEEDMQYQWDLYSSALDEAPQRSDTSGVTHEAKITLSLAKCFKRQKGDNGQALAAEAANIKVVFRMSEEKGILLVEALYDRKVVGKAEIDYTKSQKRQVTRSAGLR